MGGGSSNSGASVGMYSRSPTTSPRSIRLGLGSAYSHEGAGGGSPEDPTGNFGFVYPAMSLGGGALGCFAHTNYGRSVAGELPCTDSRPFFRQPSHKRLLWLVIAFVYGCVILTVLYIYSVLSEAKDWDDNGKSMSEKNSSARKPPPHSRTTTRHG
jgi:hypothetical protein